MVCMLVAVVSMAQRRDVQVGYPNKHAMSYTYMSKTPEVLAPVTFLTSMLP